MSLTCPLRGVVDSNSSKNGISSGSGEESSSGSSRSGGKSSSEGLVLSLWVNVSVCCQPVLPSYSYACAFMAAAIVAAVVRKVH